MTEYSPIIKAKAVNTIAQKIDTYLKIEGAGCCHVLYVIGLDNYDQLCADFDATFMSGITTEATSALKSVFRATDMIMPVDDEHFIVLMKKIKAPQTAKRKAEEILAAMLFSTQNEEEPVEISAGVGGILFTAGEAGFNTLYSRASEALSEARAKGKNSYHLIGAGDDEAEELHLLSAIEGVDMIHLCTLLEYMEGGVIVAEVSDDIQITYVSPSLYRSFGTTKPKAKNLSERVLSLVVPEDLAELKEAMFEAARNNSLIDHSFRINSDDGGVKWHHIKAKCIPKEENGVKHLVSAITDISFIMETEEHLREAQIRYRTAVEQTKTLLWEVDINSRTLTLTGPLWEKMGYTATVFPEAQESFLITGSLHHDSFGDFRQMMQEIYAGINNDNYYFKVYAKEGELYWCRATFTLLRDKHGKPYRALGSTITLSNIDEKMRRFEQETAFADVVGSSLFGCGIANLTKNSIGNNKMEKDPRYAEIASLTYDQYHTLLCQQFIDEDDVEAVRIFADREHLKMCFRNGERWKFLNYRRINPGGSRRWIGMFLKLQQHPISRDLYSFCYLRDNEAQIRREQALGMPLHHSAPVMLYSKEAMETLSRHIISTCHRENYVAIAVVELIGLDRVENEVGTAEAEDIMFTFGRICRMSIAGDVIIGKVAENRIALFRADIKRKNKDNQHARVSDTMTLLKKLFSQARPKVHINFICGFTQEQASKASYELLLRKATLACQSASQALGESAVDYVETGIDELYDDSIDTLAERYRALELRYQQQSNLIRISENDELTGLLNRRTFYHRVREKLNAAPNTKYAIVLFDVNRFKVYNDVLGTAAGDRLLIDLANAVRERNPNNQLFARLGSNTFALLNKDRPKDIESGKSWLCSWLANYSPNFKIHISVGVYHITETEIGVSQMCDRALLALNDVKKSFESNLGYYNESLRDRLLEEQALLDDLDSALEHEEFELYFQPQFNYESNTLIGAEALIRWNHPTRGLLTPYAFIPTFEKNGLITKLDIYVWDKCCEYISKWQKLYPQIRLCPISVNMSRLDIYNLKLCNTLKKIIGKYHLSASALKLEITESAYMENPQHLIDTVKELQNTGFSVEMDDFGSGYSSLNTLKDVSVDSLKLDMKFLENCEDNTKGGSIISSVIRMAHWLKLPIIAEGVETSDQAEYLKSLNCFYMQGYYFAKPMPAKNFEEILKNKSISDANRLKNVNTEGIASFWDASAQTTLLFNSFVGGAAILEYNKDLLSIVRANDRFYAELGTTREEYMDKQYNTFHRFNEKNAALCRVMLEKALKTGDESECEIENLPLRAGGEPFWIHNRIRFLAKNGDISLFYLSIENVTERRLMEEERESENERNQLLMKTTGAYFFDYDYRTDKLFYQLYDTIAGSKKHLVPNARDYIFNSGLLDAEGVANFKEDLLTTNKNDGNGEIEFRADFGGKGMRWFQIRYVKLKDDNGQAYRLVGQALDIQKEKEKEAFTESIRKRLNAKSSKHSFDDVIVNQIFNLFYETPDIGSAIETTLALLGDYFKLSHVYIFEDTADHTAMRNTFDWCGPKNVSRAEEFKEFPYDIFGSRERYIENFDESGAFYWLDTFKPTTPTHHFLKKQNVFAVLQYALMENGEFSGFIGFNETKRNSYWTEEQIGTMMFVSRIITSFLIKMRRADNADFSADFLAALDDNAAYTYIIDPKSFEIIYSNKAIRDANGKDFIGDTCYKEFVDRATPCPNCPVLELRNPDTEHTAEIRRSNGVTLLTQASPLRWNGRDMAMLSCINITKSKKAEAALITEKRKTDLALAASDLALWTYEIAAERFDNTHKNINNFQTSSSVFGAYQTVLKVNGVLPESVNDYISLHEKVKRGEKTARAIIHFNPDLYKTEWMDITYTTIFDDNGKPTAAIAVGQDITKQKQAEERYQQEVAFRKTLGSDYILTMRINITKDAIEDVQCMDMLKNMISPDMRRDEIVPLFAQGIPYSEERKEFMRFFSTEHMLNAYAQGKTEISIKIHSLNHADSSLRRLEVNVKFSKHPGSDDIIAFVAIRDQTAQALTTDIMEKIIATEFDYIAHINGTTKQFKLFAANDDLRAVLPQAGADFDKAAKEMAKLFTDEDEARQLTANTRVSRVKKELAKGTGYVVRYRTTASKGSRTKELTFHALNNDQNQIMLTRRDITESLEKEIRDKEIQFPAPAVAKDADN